MSNSTALMRRVMTDARSAAKGGLSLLEALRELGWLPLLLMGLGGLSIVDILETAVFGDLNLLTPFQLLLDGYHRITRLIGAGIEPPLQLVLDWINDQLQLAIRLHPHWRPLLVLGLVVVGSFPRGWRVRTDQVFESQRRRRVLAFVLYMLGALLGAVAGGLIPPSASTSAASNYIAASLLSGVPLATLLAFDARGPAPETTGSQKPTRSILDIVSWGAPGGLALGGLCGGTSYLVFQLPGSGIIGFAIAVAVIGMFYLQRSAAQSRLASTVLVHIAAQRSIPDRLRAGSPKVMPTLHERAAHQYMLQGLSILGGFLAAGLMLIADWALKALG